jgi:hypothetical protein
MPCLGQFGNLNGADTNIFYYFCPNYFALVKKEVQNSFWWGFGGVPQYKFPQDWGIKGVDKGHI